MSILKTDRRQEVPDNKLLETILNIESALVVLWNNTEDHKLRFQVHMKDPKRETFGQTRSFIITEFNI